MVSPALTAGAGAPRGWYPPLRLLRAPLSLRDGPCSQGVLRRRPGSPPKPLQISGRPMRRKSPRCSVLTFRHSAVCSTTSRVIFTPRPCLRPLPPLPPIEILETPQKSIYIPSYIHEDQNGTAIDNVSQLFFYNYLESISSSTLHPSIR